jgi:hypothetical protein
VLRFATDALLGTAYVEGKVALMWDVTFATAGGLVAAPLTWGYLRRHESVGRRELDVHGRDDGTDGDARSPEQGAGATGSDDADDGSDTGDRTLTLAVRGMQLALAGITLFALVTFRWGLVANAGVPLAVTFLPALLERDLGVPMNAGLVAWITLAVFLHAVGAVGPYQWFGWYDSLTHTLSATVVAGAGYASARAVDLHTDRLAVPSPFMGAFVVAFVLAFGVLWEIMEFGTGGLASVVGGEAVLAQYGVRDIALDLTFNAVGAVLVALLGASRLRGVAGDLASRFGTGTA